MFLTMKLAALAATAAMLVGTPGAIPQPAPPTDGTGVVTAAAPCCRYRWM